jgi:hypothetical protein
MGSQWAKISLWGGSWEPQKSQNRTFGCGVARVIARIYRKTRGSGALGASKMTKPEVWLRSGAGDSENLS